MNNYKLLPALVSILNTRNLTESAVQLNVTQSAMSKTLGLIRDAFHDPILIREGNRFILTKRAEQLKKQLPSLVNDLDALFSPLQFDVQLCQRKFTIAFSSFVAKSILPLVCAEVETIAPDVSFETQMWQEEKLEDLASSEIDLVATIAAEIPENLHGKLMAEDQYVVIFRKNNVLATKKMTFDSYINAKHILVKGVGDRRRQVDKALQKRGNKRKVFAKVPSFHAAIEVLLVTNTVMTLPLHIASKYVEKFDLAVRPIPMALVPHQYYLLWHAKHHQDPAHKWFRELCIQLLTRHLNDKIETGLQQLNAPK